MPTPSIRGLRRHPIRIVALLRAAAVLPALVACVTASPAPTERDGVYTLWAQYGLVAGNWDRAEHDAIARARDFCAEKGRAYVLVREQKTGTPGATALRSTVSFRCEKGFSPLAATSSADCGDQISDPELDPIRSKVELSPAPADSPPPFQIAANDTYPSEVERKSIAKWASWRDACLAQQRAASRVPGSAKPLQATYLEQDNAFADEIAGKISALIIALYQGKLTYGEFAQKRHEIDRDGAAAEREFRQATLVEDPQRALQAQQLALQNFQLKITAWSTDIQAINSRAPQTTAHVQQNAGVH
jgi:hypothetical protein